MSTYVFRGKTSWARLILSISISLALFTALSALTLAEDAPEGSGSESAVEEQSTNEGALFVSEELSEVVDGDDVPTSFDDSEAAPAESEPTPLAEEAVSEENILDGEVIEDDFDGEGESDESEADSLSPILTTDRSDYHPGETATIFGRFFTPLKNFILKVFGSDEDDENYTETTETVTTDEVGSFSFDYVLDALYRPYYEVAVSTPEGENVAETWFRDAAIGGYDQCSNDDGDGYATADTGCRWINGAINPQNSIYQEGDATVQRLELDGFAPGSIHTVTLQYGTTKQGKHAYDFLTTWDHSEDWITLADRCQDIEGCTTATETTFPIPNDTNGSGQFQGTVGARDFVMRGGTITAASAPQLSGSYAADSETSITLTFTVANSGSMCSTKGQVTSCAIALWFGAHVAKTSDWEPFNGTTGATTIEGAPYHVALTEFDGGSIGQRDNQMQATTVVIPGIVTIVKNTIDGDSTFNYTGTLGGNFSLTTEAGTASEVFEVLPGTYTVTEAEPTGDWDFTNLECTEGGSVNLGTRTATLTVVEADSITCTYTNSYNPPINLGVIRLDKVTVPSGAAASFGFTTTNLPTPTAPSLTDASTPVEWNGLVAGTYSITESALAGWSLTDIACVAEGENPLSEVTESATGVEIDLATNETVNCTFTNSKHPILTLLKTVVNDNGGTALDTAWTLVADGPTDSSGIEGAAAVTNAVVSPGQYALSETGGPANYTASAYSCVKNGGGPVSGNSITLDYGDVATCTITNNDDAPSLTLVKQVVNDNGGTAEPEDWVLTATGYDSQSPDAGTYDLSESGPLGYTQTSLTCDNEEGQVTSVTLGLGEDVTCTFVNNDQSASISGYKYEDMDGDGTWDAGEPALPGWTINLAGTAVGSAVTDANGYYEFTGLSAGNYTVTETAQAGWTQTSVNPAPLALVNGQAVTNVNFGNFELVTVDGSKFHDLDGDGASRETGEPYLDGWTMRLYDYSTTPWTLVATTMTDVTGSYVFTNLPKGTYRVCEVLQNGWIQTFPTGVANDSPNKAEEGPRCITKNVTTSGDEPSAANFGNYEAQDLTVTKTAATTFTRTFEWDIAKSVTPATLDLFQGDSGTVEYTVAVTKTGYTDSAWQVTGTITITNPNPASTGLNASVTSVTDTLTGGVNASVNCPAAVVIAGGSMDCTYSADLPDGESRTNTATVITAGLVGGGSGQAAVTFGEPSTKVNDSIAVTDTYAEAEGAPWEFSDSASETYSRTFTCEADEGEHNNTATITQTNQSDSASVYVNCYDLTVTKTATPSYTRTFGWTIEKTVTPSTLNLFAGDSDTVEYTVAVTKDTGTDSDWAVAGSITVANTAPIAATLTGVNDAVSGVGALTVDCPVAFPYQLPAGESLICTYSGDLPDAEDRQNTATAVLANTPEGTTDFTGSAAVTFGEPSTAVNDAVNVTDTNGSSWQFGDDGSQTYETTFACSKDEGEHNNTATIDETGASDSALVTVMCHDLEVTKTAVPAYTRTYDWDITKEVDDADVDLFTGDSQTVTYTVKATKGAGIDSDFTVSGTIAVFNPAPIDAVLVSVSDVVSDVGAMTVDCGVVFPYLLEAGETLNCTYDGILPDATDRTNTATAVLQNTPSGSSNYTGNATVDFAGPTAFVNDEVEVTDTYQGVLGETNETKTYTYERTVRCVADTNGDEIDDTGAGTYPNTAKITETGDEASQSVTVECYDLAVEKTAETSYTRTYDWEVVKTANPATLDLFQGDSGTVDYTVTVTKDAGTDSNHKVTGTITITNPAPMMATVNSVSDMLPGDISATVECPGEAPYTVAGNGGTLVCTYEKDVEGVIEGLNTATAVLENTPEGTTDFTGTAVVAFGAPTTLVNNEVTVTDTMKQEALGTTDTAHEYTYEHTFACAEDDGANSNTATIIGDSEAVLDTDDASVMVNCHELLVTKNAATSFTRTYNWNIEKTGDQTALTVTPDVAGAVNYDVTVTNTSSTDSDWAVTGTITVSNPAPVPAMVVSVQDIVSNGVVATVDCGVTFPHLLAAGADLVCSYSSPLADASDRVNTAAATLQNYAAGEATGTSDFTGSANVSFAEATMTEVDECVVVTDDKRPGWSEEVCLDDAPETIEYTLDIAFNDAYCGLVPEYTNTATLTTNDTQTTDEAAWTVDVSVVCTCTFTQGYWKTHSEYGKAPYDDTWAELSNGADTIFFLNAKSWYAVFNTPVKGNPYYQLAHQYMAAKLNVLSGAAVPANVQVALMQAEALLGVTSPAQAEKLKGVQKNTWTNLAGILGSYNEGKIGPGHCD